MAAALGPLFHNPDFAHLATAAALNLLRIADWLDEAPRAKTRHSTIEQLYRQAQAA